MKKYAPAAGDGDDLLRSRPGARARRNRPANLLVHRVYRGHDEGGAARGQRGRHSKVAHGALALTGPYWKRGMQNGYQDVGSWTFFRSADPNRMAAAWLYAQFVTSKTVSLKKSIVGLTFIRDSDIRSEYFTKNAANTADSSSSIAAPRALPGRRPARTCWTIRNSRSCGGRTSRLRSRASDAASGDGQPCRPDGSAPRQTGARGHEELPAEAQSEERRERLALRQVGTFGVGCKTKSRRVR